MKYRNPKTGEVFDDILYALDRFCECDVSKSPNLSSCYVCPLNKRGLFGYPYCSIGYVERHEKKIAKIIGYETLEDD